MSDVLDRFRLLAGDFTARLEGVSDDAWGNSTPCDEWTARDVANHAIGVQAHFLSTVEGTEAPTDPPANPVSAWAEVRAGVEAALADPDRAGKVINTPFGDMPYEMLVGRLGVVDMMIHTWDLARGTGQDETLNADAVAHAYEGMKPMDAMLRGPGMFKPAVEAPAGADLQTQFLCFLGRSV